MVCPCYNGVLSLMVLNKNGICGFSGTVNGLSHRINRMAA